MRPEILILREKVFSNLEINFNVAFTEDCNNLKILYLEKHCSIMHSFFPFSFFDIDIRDIRGQYKLQLICINIFFFL